MNAVAPLSSSTFTRSLAQSSLGIKAAAVVVGSLFIAAAAQITVPMIPVPMTMQTFAVLLVGLLYGPRLAAATLGAYLLEGAVGLPVFQQFGNIFTLIAKPATVGYLAGFFAAAVLTALVASRGGVVRALGAVVVGEVAIYALGLPWLAALIGWDKAVEFGFLPFLLGDALKAVLAVAVAQGVGTLSVKRRAA
ncbi:biotin transporter BioY [Oryzibacter oryziterrae]|uniref:biotin transporter BioY n=1 Tax=Oryzibacter oryziterrae TaxID=2766474 RepID=UPI001F02CC5C|nr:biotin transporter BioY [Oryzibacter oryziterrae]